MKRAKQVRITKAMHWISDSVASKVTFIAQFYVLAAEASNASIFEPKGYVCVCICLVVGCMSVCLSLQTVAN